MTGPTVAAFIAHVLAAHLSVPEPVRFELVAELGPAGFVDTADVPVAMVFREGPGWVIRYERAFWDKYPDSRGFLVAHELCHAAYDYDVRDWSKLTKAERKARHKVVDACAVKILRDHRER